MDALVIDSEGGKWRRVRAHQKVLRSGRFHAYVLSNGLRWDVVNGETKDGITREEYRRIWHGDGGAVDKNGNLRVEVIL